jgi:hypothetical protein
MKYINRIAATNGEKRRRNGISWAAKRKQRRSGSVAHQRRYAARRKLARNGIEMAKMK